MIIHLPTYSIYNPLSAEQIVRIEASSNYCKVHVRNGKPIVVSKVLLWFQVRLPEQLFVRVHRSHLVNKIYMQRMTGSGNNEVLLMNGDTIMISRRKKSVLKQILKDVSEIVGVDR